MSDTRFSTQEKEMFDMGIRNRILAPNPELKASNKVAKKLTMENAARKMQDGDETNYSPELLGQLVVAIVQSPRVRTYMKAILSAKESTGLNEISARNFLYSMLMVFGNGQRAGTLENHTIEEFFNFELVQGIECVRVANHKTGPSEGPASVVYGLPKLYAATRKYIKLFR